MSIMSRMKKGGEPRPPICICYGRPGIGKTYWAAQAPGAVFADMEDGLTSPDLSHVDAVPVRSYQELQEFCAAVGEVAEERGWKTVVFDTLDALNPMLIKYVCEKNGWNGLDEGKYGAGKVALVDEWGSFFEMVKWLRNDCNLGVILLGHHKAVRITPPDSEPFQQYNLTMHEDAARMIVSSSDVCLFATYPAHIVSTDTGFGKKATRAITDKPVFFTMENGSRVAKNRYGMPEKLPMTWEAVAKYVPVWANELEAEAAE